MKRIILRVITSIVFLHLLNCDVERKPEPVKSYSFKLSVPILKCSKLEDYWEHEDVDFIMKIIDENKGKFTGLMKITSSKNSRWRYIIGRYITKDSLVFTDSLAIIDIYYNEIAPGTTRLTNAKYCLKLDSESLNGKLSIVPTKLDTMFKKYIPPKNSTFNGICNFNDTLSNMENDAWDLFQKEKHLKSKFDSFQNKYNTFIFEYNKLPDSVFYSLSKLSLELLQTVAPFFDKYQHSVDSTIIHRDFLSRIDNCIRLHSNNENDLQDLREYLLTIQPEGSRSYLTWNNMVHNFESRLAWLKYKMQNDPEFSGKRLSKDEVASKNISRAQEFYLSVDPQKIHPLEKLDYFYDFSNRVIQYYPSYKDTLLKLIDEAQKENSDDEEYIFHINRVKDVINKYVNLNKRLGNPAPDFVAKDIYGKTINLKSYREKVVYLEFWTTWCGSCRWTIPKLKLLYEKYQKSGFEIIGIAPDKFDDVLKVCEDEHISWPQVVPNTNNAANLTKLYGAAAYPTGFLVDKKGIIVEMIYPGDERFDFILQQYLHQ